MLGLLAGMAVSLALPVVAVSVAEQDFPSKPIRIIAPFGPGTATDTVARVIANEMGKLTGQSVVVENKPGAEWPDRCASGGRAGRRCSSTLSRDTWIDSSIASGRDHATDRPYHLSHPRVLVMEAA